MSIKNLLDNAIGLLNEAILMEKRDTWRGTLFAARVLLERIQEMYCEGT